ncbi:TULIP family P47-like protein [Streptacidiphilus rugosus]|uniref:TULIP family P47-like protein n=1 Tax=Streptacidiphilus rugosus TaxID=405783 RepID=UPI0018DD332F|nr:TULIP family P47-like protein [Streptacidiphilus rugosus]
MNIYGWDTVCVLSVDTANAALKRSAAQLVTEFKYSGHSLSTNFDLHGRFGAWQIVPGGSGSLLRLALPFAEGAVVPAAASGVDLTGCTAVVDIALELLPTPVNGGNRLVFSLHGAQEQGAAPTPGVVTPVHLDGPSDTLAKLGAIGQGLVLNGVVAALAANAAEVSFVFASLDPLGADADAWLAPVRSAFLYLETAGGHGWLAVLSTTDARDITGLQHTVDPEVLGGGPQVALAVSPDLFLRHLIAPGLPQVFGGGADPGCFGFDPNAHQITAAHPFSTQSVKEGAIWYTPRVSQLRVGVVGSALAVQVSGDCDLKAGISMNWWSTSQHLVRFDPAGQRLVVDGDPNARSGHSASIPWWFWAGGLIVEGITQAVVAVIVESLSSALNSRMGTVGLGALPARNVRWLDAAGSTVTGAGLDGSLMLGGTLA